MDDDEIIRERTKNFNFGPVTCCLMLNDDDNDRNMPVYPRVCVCVCAL